MSNVCLPIEEELVDALLQNIGICLEILTEMTIEKKEKAESLSTIDIMHKVQKIILSFSYILIMI